MGEQQLQLGALCQRQGHGGGYLQRMQVAIQELANWEAIWTQLSVSLQYPSTTVTWRHGFVFRRVKMCGKYVQHDMRGKTALVPCGPAGQSANVLETSLDVPVDHPALDLANRPWLRAYLPAVQPPLSYEPYDKVRLHYWRYMGARLAPKQPLAAVRCWDIG